MAPILILGGGINGAAIARELVLRGCDVCLVEAADVASGATSASSRLIHGGLRYLEYGEVDLVRESLEERTRLLRLAPQFVRPLRLFVPIQRRLSGFGQAAARYLGIERRASRPAPRGLWVVRAGLRMYDRLARDPELPPHAVHRLGDAGVPAVDADAFRWLVSYYDAQIPFAERFVLAMLADARVAAAERGVSFAVWTYCRASLHGRTVEVRRAGTDDVVAELTPAAIVNATGAWVDHTLRSLAIDSRRLIGGTKGSHLLTRHRGLAETLGGDGIYTEAADGRPVFLLPLGGGTLIGTTDLPFDGTPDEAIANDAELDYLLDAVRRVFPQFRLTRDDVDFHYSGVRPLPFVGDGRTPASVTRRHWLECRDDTPVPLFSVIGGKLTTCRSLAKEAAATILPSLSHLPRQASDESPTRSRLVPGGERFPATDAALAAEQRRIAAATGLSANQVAAVWSLCGSEADRMLTSGSDGTTESVAATSLPVRYVRRVLRDEWVTRLSDLVERRLMLLYFPGWSDATLQHLATLLGELHGWTPAQCAEEVRSCRERLATRYGVRR